MDIELVTDVERLSQLTESWNRLADKVDQPRACASIVVGWAKHMMPPGLQLRVWIASEKGRVVGVLPLVAEPLPNGHEYLIPTATDLMYGCIPIAEFDREEEICNALTGELARSTSAIDAIRVDWIPNESPWLVSFNRLLKPQLGAANLSIYSSSFASPKGWFERRQSRFKSDFRRRARRREEHGIQLHSTIELAQIIERLPIVQALYRGRQEARGGEGYCFDQSMVDAITDAIKVSNVGRFRLVTLEHGDATIAMQLSLCSTNRSSGWLTGFDSHWSQFAPGTAVLAGSIDISAQFKDEVLDFGVGDEPYKDYMVDGEYILRSGVWCRPRMARLLQAASGGN